MSRARWSALPDGIVYVVLTILVWGVNAFQRGLWQDDVLALGEAFWRSTRPFGALFRPSPSPLRRLTEIPSALAWATPWPIQTLHVLCASVWLGEAMLAGWIVTLVLPGRRWTRFTVVCLVLTATSDLGTGSIVGLAYNVAALFLLAAIGCALLWISGGGIIAVTSSMALLSWSLLTMEVALPALPFLAVLFVWHGGRRAARRIGVLLAAWGVIVIPAALIERSFLRDPKSYAAVALLPASLRRLVWQAIVLWLENFLPWRWAFSRPEWWRGRPPASVIPVAWMAAGALFAAALFLLRLRTKRDDAAIPAEWRRELVLAGLLVVMALAANAAYASVWFSHLHYRTHILSRIWASAAIGIAAGWAAARWPRLRVAAYAAVAVFVFFGTWGGFERQDYFLASWRSHQRELASILDAAPAIRPGTAVILRGTPPLDCYMATSADYLTTHWLRMLYDNANLRTFRLDPRRGSDCGATIRGVLCHPEGREIAFDNKESQVLFRFNALVVMDYDPASGRWRLLRSLRSDRLASGHETEAKDYRPAARIIERPWTLRQERLLLEGDERVKG